MPVIANGLSEAATKHRRSITHWLRACKLATKYGLRACFSCSTSFVQSSLSRRENAVWELKCWHLRAFSSPAPSSAGPCRHIPISSNGELKAFSEKTSSAAAGSLLLTTARDHRFTLVTQRRASSRSSARDPCARSNLAEVAPDTGDRKRAVSVSADNSPASKRSFLVADRSSTTACKSQTTLRAKCMLSSAFRLRNTPRGEVARRAIASWQS
mmetsp:Transcript_70479/g.187706  ORF Transcript_70479/g.187706 Transcript_70479/m.187706 type:complete len:213 (-) Transcript_70479:314-952(-)